VPTLDNRVPPDSESLEPKNAVKSDATVRVHVGLLDKLMNLVGELVLTRNEVLQLKIHTGDSASLSTYQRLNLITTELQENVMKTRMQPIGNVLSKLPRMVHDVAAICEKHVRLEIDGKDTELDKTIIEAIKDPLTHIVRNSIDHGIELPELRAVRRKPREGLLKIRAYHEGGQVNIEITDDGGGIDHDLLKQKCLEKGLISPEQSAQMSRHEALHLIFLPGLSTTEKITNISGRGVGMDVVKTNIENIGGSVDLQSHLGSGTTIRIKIPLTLAIIPALIVTSGGDRFAIPQVSLQELLRLDGSQTADQIEFIDGVPFYRLRGQLLPLAYLNRELQLAHEFKTSLDSTSIVVLQADGRLFGLVVDAINDTEEIVVKPLSKHLKNVGVFAGATIMGDGKVALIIDVLGLTLHVSIVTPLRDRSMNEKAMPAVKTVNAQHSLLIFDAGQGSRMAIPLTMVARLEEFPLSSIERSGIREVVRYRGQILPLIRVSDYVPAITDVPKETKILPVVVYTVEGRSVGLIVGRITDIIQEKIVVKRHSHGNSIFGSVVIQEKVTDLLDVQAIIRASEPEFFSSNLTMQAAA
jgi:two-component system chemotaxis sensor kinase CheA